LFTPTLVDDLGTDFVSGPLKPEANILWLHAHNEPTNDINVRKALIMAVNSEELFKAAFPKGPHAPVTQVLSPVLGEDPDYKPFPYDPEGAKAALAASSYGSAANLPKLMFVGISMPSHEAAAQYAAEQWRKVLGIEAVEMNASIDQYTGPDQGRIQIFRDDVGARIPDAVAYLMASIHSSSGNAQNKMGGYANPEVDSLLEEAATKGTDDPDRFRLALEAQRVYREDWMFIPYYYVTNQKWAMPWVKNFDKNPDWQVIEPWNVYIEK
jgi:peptide/nickel transport system substrate-binding protein